MGNDWFSVRAAHPYDLFASKRVRPACFAFLMVICVLRSGVVLFTFEPPYFFAALIVSMVMTRSKTTANGC